jgi:hypothetical protein
VRAEAVRLHFLVGARGEGRDLAAHRARELQRQVAEPSDPDDADAHLGPRVAAERRVHRDAGAQQRRRMLRRDRLREREREARVDADPLREAAVVLHAGRDLVRAEVLFAADAGLALETRPSLPADADALAFREPRDLRAERRDRADDLVAGHHRVSADAPVAIDEMDVAVADPAVADPELDVVWAESRGRVRERREPAPGAARRVRAEAHAAEC